MGGVCRDPSVKTPVTNIRFADLVLGRGVPFVKASFLAADLFRFLRNPCEQRDFWRDLRASWSEWSEVRALCGRLSKDSDREALVISLTTWPFQIKMESMLAYGLVRNGWRVRFLVRSRRDRWAIRYLSACGFSDLVFWDDYQLDGGEAREVDAALADFEGRCGGFQEVKNWNYRGCWIGAQLLASVSRGIMEGSPDPTDPRVRARLIKLLPKTLRTVWRAEKALGSLRPDLLLITEANYAVRGALTDAAIGLGLDMVQFGLTPRDDALILRRLTKATRREHPISLTPDTMRRVAAEPWSDRKEQELADIFEKRYNGSWFLQGRNQQGTKHFSREKASSFLGLDPAKKTVVVFSHVLWDANLFFGTDLFEDYGDWFVQTVRAACANPRVNWLIKLHPANKWKRAQQKVEGEYTEFTLLRKHLGEPSGFPGHVRFLLPDTPVSTPSLFRLLDLGVTVRGTVSAELPCWGKPVMTAGTGRCHGHGFTIDSTTREEYLERLARAEEIPPPTEEQVLLAKKHAHALFTRRPWIFTSFRARYEDESRGRKTVGQSFIPVPGAGFEDLDGWAEWAGAGTDLDYLAPDGG